MASKKPAKKKSASKKSKKPLAFLTSNPVADYLKGAYTELRKVTWPNRSESIRLTIGVIIYSLFFVGFIAVVDYVFGLGFEQFII